MLFFTTFKKYPLAVCLVLLVAPISLHGTLLGKLHKIEIRKNGSQTRKTKLREVNQMVETDPAEFFTNPKVMAMLTNGMLSERGLRDRLGCWAPKFLFAQTAARILSGLLKQRPEEILSSYGFALAKSFKRKRGAPTILLNTLASLPPEHLGGVANQPFLLEALQAAASSTDVAGNSEKQTKAVEILGRISPLEAKTVEILNRVLDSSMNSSPVSIAAAEGLLRLKAFSFPAAILIRDEFLRPMGGSESDIRIYRRRLAQSLLAADAQYPELRLSSNVLPAFTKCEDETGKPPPVDSDCLGLLRLKAG